MAGKAKALKNFYGFKPQLHTVGDKQWCCLILNDPNDQYGYKEDSFKIDFLSVAGYVQDGQHWLLGTVTDKDISSDGCYDFDAKKRSDKTNEKTGKAIWVSDDELNSQLKSNWANSGNLVAIKVDDMPSLKCLAIALHQTRYIAKNPVTVYLQNSTVDKPDTLIEDLVICLDRLIEVSTPNHTDPYYSKMLAIAQLGVLVIPIPSNDKVPSIEIKDIFGNPTETKTLCVPYRGNLPKYEGIDFTLPSEPVKKPYTPNGAITTVYTPDERLTWVCNALKASGVPLESDTLRSIYDAIRATDANNELYHIALHLSGVAIPFPYREYIPPQNKIPTSTELVENINHPVTNSDSATNNGYMSLDTHKGGKDKFTELDRYRDLLEERNLTEEPTKSVKRSNKQIQYLIQILESTTYQKQLADLIVWIINNIGTKTNILELTEPQLAKVANAVFHNDNMLAVNPDQHIATLVL